MIKIKKRKKTFGLQIFDYIFGLVFFYFIRIRKASGNNEKKNVQASGWGDGAHVCDVRVLQCKKSKKIEFCHINDLIFPLITSCVPDKNARAH